MEDAHVTNVQLAKGLSVFAVFDGHGGHEVAAFCGKHFVNELTRLPKFTEGNYKSALEESFLKLDAMMSSEAG